jgi:hypothetical protein
MRVIAWLTSFTMPRTFSLGAFRTWASSLWTDLFRGGESQIAMELGGEEVIHEEEWSELPEEERARWEPVDEPMPLYRRKPW